MTVTAGEIKTLARECGFELAGIAPALPHEDFGRFETWRAAGMAGEMGYLTDHRGDIRKDPRHLLPTAKSMVCVGKLYNTPFPHSTDLEEPERGWISRYAWGADYHDVMREGLERLAERISQRNGEPLAWKICVDTAPLLERSYARAAGLGWIGKNTCLINQEQGSWYFLGELLLSIPLAPDSPPPDRCGTCRRCIDACPTDALVPTEDDGWTLDARKCISYLTIEKRGDISEELQPAISNHVFGCDICQDVCPWNQRAPMTSEVAFAPVEVGPSLRTLESLSEAEFRERYLKSPIQRTKYAGFLRNVRIALKNAGLVVALIAVFAGGMRASVPLQDPATNPGWVAFYNNEYDQALDYFEQQVKAHPDDPSAYDHVAQAILYRQMFRDGALESELVTGNNPFLKRAKLAIAPQDKQRFAECINQALALSAAALQKNPADVLALYAAGVAHGLQANYLFLVEKAWLQALHEFTAARKLNQEILRVDPTFVDARLVLGLDKYVVGCLPFYLRAIGSIGGFHGDKQGGIRQLEQVSREGVLDRYDAQILLAVIYRREHCPTKGLPLLQAAASRFPRNYLLQLEQVQLFSDAGDKDDALKVLAHVEELRQSQAPGYASLSAAKVQYMRGNLLFWYGDLDRARTDLKQATGKADELDLNTALLAWLRLGQVYDLREDHREATEAYREAIKAAPSSEIAAEAKNYISSPYRRKQAAG